MYIISQNETGKSKLVSIRGFLAFPLSLRWKCIFIINQKQKFDYQHIQH